MGFQQEKVWNCREKTEYSVGITHSVLNPANSNQQVSERPQLRESWKTNDLTAAVWDKSLINIIKAIIRLITN